MADFPLVRMIATSARRDSLTKQKSRSLLEALWRFPQTAALLGGPSLDLAAP
jgi:hypothetical protein